MKIDSHSEDDGVDEWTTGKKETEVLSIISLVDVNKGRRTFVVTVSPLGWCSTDADIICLSRW